MLAHDCLLYERQYRCRAPPQSSGVAETKESLGSAKRLTQSMSRKILRTLVNDPREDAKGQAWCPFIA
jgi:hypothetical protein